MRIPDFNCNKYFIRRPTRPNSESNKRIKYVTKKYFALKIVQKLLISIKLAPQITKETLIITITIWCSRFKHWRFWKNGMTYGHEDDRKKYHWALVVRTKTLYPPVLAPNKTKSPRNVQSDKSTYFRLRKVGQREITKLYTITAFNMQKYITSTPPMRMLYV